jgi:hypothetical protein
MTANDVSGFWRTKQAIYQFFQRGPNILAVYFKPSQEQTNSGIKAGDIAYVGDIVGQIASGRFHHRFSLADQANCPANWYETTQLYLTVSKDWTTMEGDLLLDHISDTCAIDNRMLDHLVFTRIQPGAEDSDAQTLASTSQPDRIQWATGG